MEQVLNAFRIVAIFCKIIASGLLFHILMLRMIADQTKQNILLQKIGDTLVHLLPKFGPGFIKAGQFLATRPDLIGEMLSKKLEALQDNVPQCEFKHIKKILSNSHIIEDLKSIDENAVAAASIAQIHKCYTIDGNVLALKILRPNVRELFKKNFSLMKFVASVLSYIFDLHHIKIGAIIARVEKASMLEMDLRMEAASAEKLRQNILKDNNIYIPKIFWQYTNSNVMALEWVDGIPIYAKQKLIDAGYNIQAISKKLAITFFNQAFVHGFFHADLHQGNILVNCKQQVVLLDFGIMGHLDYANKRFIAHILKNFIERNYDMVAQLHMEAGYCPKEESLEIFSLACRSIGEAIFNRPPKYASISLLLSQLFETARQFNMEIQPQLLLLQKTMISVEGISIYLDQDTNIWLLIKPWIKKWAKSHFGLKGAIEDKMYNAKYLINKLLLAINSFELAHPNNTSDVHKSSNTKFSNHFKIITAFCIGVIVSCIALI